MGLVRRASPDNVAAGTGNDDMSTIIRQSVAAEIERQRLAKVQRDDDRNAEPHDDAEQPEDGD
jgi:hypothetical protein